VRKEGNKITYIVQKRNGLKEKKPAAFPKRGHVENIEKAAGKKKKG